MNTLIRISMIFIIATSINGCASPKHFSKYNTSDEQMQNDWSACVDQVRGNAESTDKSGTGMGGLGAMMGEYMWGAPLSSECMRNKGYQRDE